MARDNRFKTLHHAKRVALILIPAALGFLAHVNAQPVDPLLDEGVQILIEKHEIVHLQKIGQLDPDKAQQRLQANKQRWVTYSRKIGQWPQEKQLAFTAQLKKRNAAALASLQQKWAEEARQLQKEGGAKAGQESASTATPAQTDTGGARPSGQTKSGPDVLGLRIGMTPDEARKIIKSRVLVSEDLRKAYTEVKKTLAFTLPTRSQSMPVPNGEYVSGLGVVSPQKDDDGSQHRFAVAFAPIPGQESIVAIERFVYPSASKKSTFDAFEKALVEKYGTPTYLDTTAVASYLYWSYDSNGTLQKPGFFKDGERLKSQDYCPMLAMGGGIAAIWGRDEWVLILPTIVAQSISFDQLPARCGSILLRVLVSFDGKYTGRETLVQDYHIAMTGFDAAIRAHEAAKARIDGARADANAAAIKKGQQQKPAL